MIAHNSPTCSTEEAQAAATVVRSGWLAQGREVEAFEDELCEFLGLPHKHAVALSSGTAALFMALWALGVQGRIVAFPVYVCSALRNAVAMAGAKELLLDVGSQSPNLDSARAVERSADVLIAPHMFGLPMDLAMADSIPVIEDCAQAIGASVRGVRVGLQGRVGVFSFYATKMITSGGQGGMLVAKDKSLADAVRDYRDFDCRPDRKLRFNFQMTDLQAAIGRIQLRKLPGFIHRREQLFSMYREAGLDMLDTADEPGLQAVRYRAVLKTKTPGAVIKTLAENGVRAIVPIEDWELLGDGADYPNALRLARETVSLPVYPTLSDAQAAHIAACLKGLQ